MIEAPAVESVAFRSGTLLIGDVLDGMASLPERSVHCCVTSPPYFALRDYQVKATNWPAVSFKPMADLPAIEIPAESCPLGMESSHVAFVAHLVAVFREVRRVLRDDGVLWLNLGDSMAGSWGAQSRGNDAPGSLEGGSMLDARRISAAQRHASGTGSKRRFPGLKPKDMACIPWRVALALQADGWWLRQDVVWSKPSPMPYPAKDRCVTSHEPVFLLAKSPDYFFDYVAIQEPASRGSCGSRFDRGKTAVQQPGQQAGERDDFTMRNKRSVWRVSFEGYKGAHFAVYPTKLIEPMILAGTSAKGACAACGAQHVRQIEKKRIATRPGNATKVGRASAREDSPHAKHNGSVVGNRDPQRHTTSVETIGWAPDCRCSATIAPAVVLDPFMGSGTTAAVAVQHNRRWIGCELNPANEELVRGRLNGLARKLAFA